MFLNRKFLTKPIPLFFLGVVFAATLLALFLVFIAISKNNIPDSITSVTKNVATILQTPTPTQTPIPNFFEIPIQTHVFQSFNNCGPATLSMALSYVQIQKDQTELGQILRPYQIPGGDNDDKSVTLREVADQAETYGLHSYLRPNGTIEKLEQFIAHGIPVVTRTWLKPNEDIGHYRVIRGYNKETQEIIQDDSLQGKNLRYSYDDFNEIWQPFNYEYLVIVTSENKEVAERILGEELREETAWENARVRIENELSQNPSNWHLLFALSRINYYLKNYEKSVEYYNQVENRLSFRTLWYQIEPLLSIFETQDYDRVLQISDRILNNQNRAYSELYLLRGKVYIAQGNIDTAKSEFDKAVFYNSGFRSKIPQL